MTSYNEWLKDYLMQGGAPTHVYDRPGAKGFVCIENNPHLVSLPLGKMRGAMSKNFVLSRQYDVEKYQGRFYGGHNSLYGWDGEGKAKVYGRIVPVYEDTVDRLIALDEETPSKVRNVIFGVRKREAERAKRWAAECESRRKQSDIAQILIEEVLGNSELYIKDSSCVTSYNEWLKDYLMQGGAPTHVYDRPGAKGFVCIENNPHLVSLPLGKMRGAMSKNFVLSRQYDVKQYRNRFYGGHNELYGWDSEGKARAYGGIVPLYEDTVDRLIALDEEAPIEVRYKILKFRQKEAKRQAEWDSKIEADHLQSEMNKRYISEVLHNPDLYKEQ